MMSPALAARWLAHVFNPPTWVLDARTVAEIQERRRLLSRRLSMEHIAKMLDVPLWLIGDVDR